MFGKKELNAILISILIIGFVFGFNDGRESFDLNYWLSNFIKVILIVAFSILLREIIIKLAAKKKGCTSEYEVWGLKRYGYFEHEKFKKGIPFMSMIAILLTLISNGKVFFTAIGNNIIKADRNLRVGKKFTRLDQFSEGLIFVSGILVTALLTILFAFFDKISWVDFGLIVNVNFWLTVWALLPIPSLNGGRLFMDSRILYIFVLALVVIMFLLKDINIILNLVLSVILAGILILIYYYLIEY